MSNPDEAAARGNWSDPEFLANTCATSTRRLRHTQFADFHGHGWVFRAVFKKDRKGNLLDHDGDVVRRAEHRRSCWPPSRLPSARGARRRQGRTPPRRRARPPDGHPPGEGDALRRLPLRPGRPRQQPALQARSAPRSRSSASTATAPSAQAGRPSAPSGPAAYTSQPRAAATWRRCAPRPASGASSARATTSIQNSMVEPRPRAGRSSRRPTPSTRRSRRTTTQKSRLAKTVRFEADGQMVWGDLPGRTASRCAHANKNMSCIACHSSWNPSCFGCHLPQKANMKMPSCTTRATSRATTSPTTSRPCATTSSCSPATAT